MTFAGPSSVSTPDIVLVGGGVIGLTTALKLADRGLSVTILDRQIAGTEASWAGAGMLPPGNPAHASTPEARLRAYSHSLWRDFSAELLNRTGINNEYRVCGAIEVFSPESRSELEEQIRQWTLEEIRVQQVSRTETNRLVADLNPAFESIIYLPDFAQVRNPRHLQALRAACLQQGVELIEHCDTLQFNSAGEQIIEVVLSNRSMSCHRVCITAGAWSTSLLASLGFSVPMKPVRGQIVQLRLPVQPFQCVIEEGRRYLVPRQDGLVLIGSTEEDVGFVKENTAEGVSGLLDFSRSLVPSLAKAEVVRTWAGLRPGSPDELPLLGAVPGFSNLFVGAGHFRSGLQMSPGTATILADLLMDITPAVSLLGLTADRFQA